MGQRGSAIESTNRDTNRRLFCIYEIDFRRFTKKMSISHAYLSAHSPKEAPHVLFLKGWRAMSAPLFFASECMFFLTIIVSFMILIV